MSDDEQPHNASSNRDEVDDGLAFAYGEDRAESTSPNAIARTERIPRPTMPRDPGVFMKTRHATAFLLLALSLFLSGASGCGADPATQEELRAIASASIGQVHRARLKSGEHVAPHRYSEQGGLTQSIVFA